jgi:thiol:disulfide interchange protein DsbD
MKHRSITIHLTFLLTAILFFQLANYAQQKSLAEAKLVVDSYSPEKDSIISIGLLINLQDEWHIYWRNPGDSGLPTDIEFSLPNGITASEIKFPIPKIFSSDEIVNYGYDHQVLLMSELFIPKDYTQKEIFISAKLTSLICKELCKAFDTIVTFRLNLSKDYLAEVNISNLFESTKNSLPQKNHNLKTSAISKSDSVYLKVSCDGITNTNSLKFFSYEAGVFKNSITQNVTKKENYLELILEPDPFKVNNPTEVNGIIFLNVDHTKAYEINLPITN